MGSDGFDLYGAYDATETEKEKEIEDSQEVEVFHEETFRLRAPIYVEFFPKFKDGPLHLALTFAFKEVPRDQKTGTIFDDGDEYIEKIRKEYGVEKRSERMKPDYLHKLFEEHKENPD